VSEKGKKAVLLNKNRQRYVRTRFDGCVVKNETAADWILSKPKVGDLIVELKGCDVDHAAWQVTCTARYLRDNTLQSGPKIGGIIISSRYPSEDTKFQRLQLKFAKGFKGPLRSFNRMVEIEFDRAISMGRA
jgi:hypothetical protein